MKKITAILISVMLLAFALLPVTAFAWGEPELMLAAAFDEETKTITVEYRVLEFTGTESADFRLKYNPSVLEFTDYETAEMSNVLMEVEEIPGQNGLIAIQFIDMYYAEEEDCEEDGSATVVTFTFTVINDKAEDAVFVASADSYNMDPNSIEKFPSSATLKIMLNQGDTTASTLETYDIGASMSEKETDGNIKKIVIAAVIAAVVLVAGTIAIVVKYRKK